MEKRPCYVLVCKVQECCYSKGTLNWRKNYFLKIGMANFQGGSQFFASFM